ncbi:PLxRFG domain-containing protein [Acinetobacter lwoffii]|uniref:PLxRFG domain-containing protein n=1 Tax=Acinetobacter lwoffii TaxID=28090 RepID=UPI00209A6760|nr:PLxRFG domain-containing protein [Acinetobacter lwoffii]MCO8114938.1 PLxRFG domain-containing protein [Acinetobacter lwoffii]
MNINQHFSNLAAKAAEEGADASQLISQRERLFKDKVIPELTKRGANDTAIVQAREKWYSQTDKVMQSAGLLPKAGQNSRSFAKDKRADKAVQEAAKTGSKLPIIKETIKSTGETIGNLFGQGVGSTIESAAGFVRDIGENEQDSISAKVADYGKNLRKEYDNSASSFQKDLQAGGSGKAAQLATGAIQSVPAMAMPFGAAKVVAKGAGAFNATKAAAPYLGMGAGVVAGHTQNYGEVRRNATENLARDFPSWEKLQGNPLFEQNFQEKLNSGLGINQARQQAHAETLDTLSEQAANKYGSAMTAIDFIAPSGAVLGSGILKNAPTSQIGKKLVGGGVDSALVKREMQQVPRTGMAKLVPDVSLAANKAAAKMVGRQALEEGLQGGIGEYGAQAASANIGGTPVDYGKVGQTVLEEGLIGGIMGGGMQSATGGSPTSQAKDVAKQLRNQTNTLRQEEAAARKELADAMQLNDPQQIQSAQDNLNNIGAEASKVKAAYDQYGIDTPYFVQRFAAQYQPQQQQAAQQGPAAQPQPQPQPAAQPQAASQPQPAAPAQVNQGMANTTNLVMDSVSNGFITPEEAQAIQTDPIRADVFTLTMTGDVAAAHNVVMNAVSLGNIDTDQAQELIQSITRYSQAKAPKKPSVSSIVNNHVKQQIHPQDRGLFSNPVELDPETFEPIDPNQPSPFQDDFNEPKAFSNPSKANDYVRINGLTDSHDIEIAEDGTLVVVKKQGIIPDDPNLNSFGYSPENIVQPTPADPNLSNFSEGPVSVDSLNADNVPDLLDPEEAQQPAQPIPTAQPDHNKPKTFTNYVRANDFVKTNGLKDSHEIIKKGEGQIIVQPKSITQADDPESDQAFDDMLNAVPPIGTPITNPPTAPKQESQDRELSNAEQITGIFSTLGNAFASAAIGEVAGKLAQGKRVQYFKTASIEAAKKNPNYHLADNEDGSVDVIGVRDDNGVWHGQAPENTETKTEQPAPSGNLSFADKFRDAHLNNPSTKPRLINDEIDSGRSRADVLKEATEIVKAISTTTTPELKADTPELKADTPELKADTPEQPAIKEGKTQKIIDGFSFENKKTNFEAKHKRSGITETNFEYDVKDPDGNLVGTAVISDKGSVYKYPDANDTDLMDITDKFANPENSIKKGGMTIEPVRTYLTQSGKVGAEIKKLTHSDGRVSYSYSGEWGAGSVDAKTMQEEENAWKEKKKGYTIQEPETPAPAQPEQKTGENGIQENDAPEGMKSGDIGRGSDGKPFLSKNAALRGLKINNVKDTHEIVELAPSQFVLRKKDQTEALKAEQKRAEEADKLLQKQADPEKVEPAQEKPKKQRTLLGKNRYGNDVYEDERGVRSYYDPLGVFITESVSITPNGIEFGGSRGNEYEVAEQQDKSNNEQVSKAYDDLKVIQKEKIDWNNTESVIQHYEKERDALLKMADMIDDKPSEQYYKDEAKKAEDSINEYQKLKSRENTDNSETVLQSALKAYHDAREAPMPKGDDRVKYYNTIIQAIDSLIKADPNNSFIWNDQKKKYEDSLGKYSKPAETTADKQESDDVQQLDQTSGKTLEAVSTEDVQGVREAGDSATKTATGSRTNVSGSRSTRTPGDDTGRSVADGEREVSISAGRNSDNNGLDPQQAVVADNAPVDAFVIDEKDIGKGGKKTKFKANIEAIKIIKQLETEKRPATKAEQKALSKFVGWGGLAEAFKREDGSIATGWTKEVAELESLLTKDEMKAAVDSSIAAHYTSPEIVKALWQAVANFGFKNGRVLEPSVGVGNFFGLMPKNMRKASNLYAVELDNITGAVAKHLYPEANVKAPMGFQDYQIIDNYFDIAIGNPPFSSITINDQVKPKISGFSLHNYFFAKSVDSLKPNGILAMVVTNRFLDKMGDKERSYIAERAELVGAIRLPNDAFLSNAGTQVTTDIIFLRKKEEGETKTGETWLDVKDYKDKDGNSVPLNEYFVRHPENMLGDFGAYGSMYRDGEPALIKREGQNTEQLLSEAIERLPKDVFNADLSQNFEETTQAVIRDISQVKVGSKFVNSDGQIHERLPDIMGEQKSQAVEFTNDKARDRVAGMIHTAEKLAALRTLQLDPDATDKQIAESRKELNKEYDAFVSAHGFINSDTNKRLMRDDPNWAQLSALEDKYDRGVSAAVAKSTGQKFRKPSAEKAAIFTKRTQVPIALVQSVSNAQDALTESLNRHGHVNTQTMQQLYAGKSESEIISELGELIFNDPINGYVVRDEYLSGNVKQKLAVAKEHAERDPKYERNVRALEKVIPADIEALDIDVKIGSHWIPANYMSDFVSHITGSPEGKAEYFKLLNKWEVTPSGVTALASATYATSRVDTKSILNHAMNGKKPTVYDNFSDGTSVINQEATQEAAQRVEMIKSAWKDWLWENDARREHLERLYNDVFNTTVNREYDGSHLAFYGMNSAIELRPHQKNAVWRSVQSKATLYDHTVGAGKTFTVIAAAMEMRRMGIANKPLIVVPNHLVGQWANDFVLLYPNANILAATKKDFEKANRKRFIAKMANGDYDAIIIAHSSFGKISISPDQEQQFIDNEIAEIMAFEGELREKNESRSRNAKAVAKRRLALEEKKKNLLNRENKDTDNIYWHELGIDSVMLDEAHEFKNLEFTTSMQNVAGLGTGKGSQKAKDLFAKIQIMQGNNPKSKLIFATGTPISNTMAEMFTMQRYLDWDNLKSQGINHFDAWATVFGEVVSDWELSPSGKYKLTNRFAKFVNMPELMQGYLGFADVMNRDDINAQLAREGKTLGTPKIKGNKPQNVVVERSDTQADYIGMPTVDENGFESYPEGSLVWRTENLPRKPEKGADNMLKIMGDARKAALDMRLIDPTAEDFEGSKVNVAANSIYDTYKQWNAKKGTQLVFCDLSTPKGAVAAEKSRIEQLIKLADEGDEAAQIELDKLSPDELSALDSEFSVYDDLKAKLIAKGIKESEIVFIHDAKTELQKQELFEKVKRGDIRVLMGSTAKMGAGMNVQNKLVALHHLDAPWRPSDLEQREGRIIRQGNEFYKANPEGFEIEINRYATKQTLDSRMWQTIESKAKFIEQVRKGAGTTRVVEDVAGEAANAAEMKAASSGDPRILEEMDLRKQIKELNDDKTTFDRGIHRTKNIIRSTENDVQLYKRKIAALEQDVVIKQPEKFEFSSGRTKIKQEDKGAREDVAAILENGIKSALAKGKDEYLGVLNGFKVSASPSRMIGTVDIMVQGNAEPFRLGSYEVGSSSPVGLIQKLLNEIKSIPEELKGYKEALNSAQKEVPALRAKIEGAKWDKSDQLKDLETKHNLLIEELKPKKKEPEQQQKQNSRRSGAGKGSTPDQIRTELVSRFGEDTIQQLEQKGILSIVPTYAEQGVEGFAENGRVTLVADAITPENIVPVFLHELGGHVGMQGVMKPETYAVLMNEFNRLVKSGNADALEAKRLAERESDAQVQADEYLPYLITVAARNQQKQGPVQRLINRVLGAVKAWAVDRLGLNLKLSPSDMVALAERMVKTVSKGTPPTPPKGGKKAPSVNKHVDRSNQTESPAFKSWFNESKVVDSNGNPLIMYHGTPKSFNQFNTNESGALLGKGSYFTAALSEASAYADSKSPMQTYLSIQNPYYVNSVMDQVPSRKELKDLGHDGVILLNEDKTVKWAVAHEPTQIKSATANSGTFDSSHPDIRYSRSSTANPQNMSRSKQRELLDKAASTAFGQLSLRGAEASKTLSNRTLNLFQTMLHKSLRDETGQFKKTFDLVQGKINHVTFASSKSMDVAPSILTQLEEGSDYWKEVKRVGRTIGHTFSGGKIDKAKVDKDLDKVGKLMFENTLLDNSERHTVKELKQLGFDDDQIGLYNEIRDAIDTSLDTFANTTFSNIYKHLGGTNEEVLELAGQDLDITDHYNEILKRIDTLTKGKPEKADARQAAIEAVDRVFKKANDLKDQGYVPLMRFGKYFVRIWNPTTGEVSYRQHFESESERNIYFRDQEKKGNLPPGTVLEKGQINELQHKLFQGVSPETVALFAKESGLPIGDAETAYIKYAVQNNHALKRLLKRQGIDGFDTDVKRVLASFVMSNARYSANQSYNPAIDESITNIEDPAFQEDAIRLRDYSLDTQEELAAVKNFAFVWYMGFSAMFGVVNLTQPLLQTFPYLMQYSKDHGTILKAFGKAVTTWRKGTDAMDPKYKAHYERARKEGHLDPQNTWMMQGLERGKSGLGASTWQLVSHASGLFAQASETVNRRTSLFAALDVAESLGQTKLEQLGFKDAYDFAVRTIQETQGIYNKGNRPRVSRGNVGSVLMMYKQFMIAYIEQMVRMQKSGLYGGDDDEFKKKMAGLVGFGVSRSVLTMLGILMAFSGTSGLPFVRDILDGIETAGGLVGKPVNTEREIQIALHDALGQTMGSAVNTALMDGIVNLNPLIDVKGRMGMGDLIPATAYFSPTTSDYMKSSEISQIAGPIGGLLEKVKESVALAQVGAYYQAGTQLLPKAGTSLFQGFDAAATGDYRNMKTGVKTNDATVLDGIVKILDAQPAGIAKEGRIRGLEMKDKSSQIYLNKRWKERYEAALESGDRTQVRDIKQQIRDYNKENPRYPIKFNQKLAETNFNKSNQTWQEKRKTVKGLEWMSEYNPYLDQ